MRAAAVVLARKFARRTRLVSASACPWRHIANRRNARVTAVAFSEHALLRYLMASGGSDKRVCVWDARTGLKLGEHTVHHSEITALTSSPLLPGVFISGDKSGRIVMLTVTAHAAAFAAAAAAAAAKAAAKSTAKTDGVGVAPAVASAEGVVVVSLEVVSCAHAPLARPRARARASGFVS